MTGSKRRFSSKRSLRWCLLMLLAASLYLYGKLIRNTLDVSSSAVHANNTSYQETERTHISFAAPHSYGMTHQESERTGSTATPRQANVTERSTPVAHLKSTLNASSDDQEAEWVRSAMTPRQARTIANYYRADYDAFNLARPGWFFRSSWEGPGAETEDFSVDYEVPNNDGPSIMQAYWSGDLEINVCPIYKVMSTSLMSTFPKSSSFPWPLTVRYVRDNARKMYARRTNETLSPREERSLVHRVMSYQQTNVDRKADSLVVVRDPVFRFGSVFRWICRWKNWECKVGPTTNFTEYYRWFFEVDEFRHKHHHAKSQTQFCHLNKKSVRDGYKFFHYRKGSIAAELQDYAKAREDELSKRYSPMRPRSTEELLDFMLTKVVDPDAFNRPDSPAV